MLNLTVDRDFCGIIVRWLRAWFLSQITWLPALAQSLTRFATMSRLFKLTVPQFLHLQNGINVPTS